MAAQIPEETFSKCAVTFMQDQNDYTNIMIFFEDRGGNLEKFQYSNQIIIDNQFQAFSTQMKYKDHNMESSLLRYAQCFTREEECFILQQFDNRLIVQQSRRVCIYCTSYGTGRVFTEKLLIAVQDNLIGHYPEVCEQKATRRQYRRQEDRD